MQFPIGILIYWVNIFDDNHSVISGMWYYKELYVPSTIVEKKKSIMDLKEKRCTVMNIYGKFDQIADILSLSDRFTNSGNHEISQFTKLIKDIQNTPKNKAYLFDDVYNVKGTALTVDTIVEVEETMEDIREYLRKGKVVDVNILENWSFAGDVLKEFKGL